MAIKGINIFKGVMVTTEAAEIRKGATKTNIDLRVIKNHTINRSHINKEVKIGAILVRKLKFRTTLETSKTWTNQN